ncbi:MAG: hypothetical protein E7497_03130 [Ruminococcus sp.]|nr:hypothetical protein [Ruminococcus sp.]
MKHRKLPILFTAGLLAVSSLAPVFSSAEEMIVCGDIDMDGTLSIFDMRRMKDCIAGNASIQKEEAFNSSDMTGDGVVDSLDMCLMRDEIGEMCGNITKDIELSDDMGGFPFTADEFPEAVITSVDELNAFFAPRAVDHHFYGWMEDYEIADESEREEFLSIYTEEFFEENVLFIKTMNQNYGDAELYEIGDVFYEGDILKIQYHKKEADSPVTCVITGVFAQVTMPKALYSVNNNVGAQVVWEETETPPASPFTLSVSETNAVDHSAYRTALTDGTPQVFTSPEELASWLDGKFGGAVVSSFKKTYDEAYFAENVLMIDLYAKSYNERWKVTPSFNYADDGNFTFFYTREYIEDTVAEGIIISQASVSKSIYSGQEVVSVKEWEEPTDVFYNYFDLGWYHESNNTRILNDYSNHEAWVNSNEELDAFLSEIATEEGIQLLKENLFTRDLDEYCAYIWMDGNIIGTSYELLSAHRDGYTIRLNMGVEQPLGCCADSFIHVLYLDKDYYWYEIRERRFCFNDDYLNTEGELIYYSPDYDSDDYTLYKRSYDTLMINQYTFENESVADIYLAHSGGGPVQYGSYTLVGTLELDTDYFPFDEDYTAEYKDSGFLFSGDDYSIHYTNSGITVEYRKSENGDMTTAEIPLKTK